MPAPPDPLTDPYADVLVGDFADEYINQMKDEFAPIPASLGCPGTNMFCPSSPATRAHAAHFLVNIFGVPAP